MGSIVEAGLYIVFTWIAQRRREIQELAQYNANMSKSIFMVLRRMRLNRGEQNVGRDLPNYLHTMLYGVRSITRSGRWLHRPDHNKARNLYHYWIRFVTAHRTTIENPDGQGSPITIRRPYYSPGF